MTFASSGRQRRLRLGAAIVASWAIAVAALTAVLLLQRSVEEERQTQVLIAQVESAVNRMDALAWQVISRRTPASVARRELRTLDRQISSDLTRLSHIDKRWPPRLKQLKDPYAATLEKQLQLLQRGREAPAIRLGETSARKRGRLLEAIGQAGAFYGREAQRATVTSYAGSALGVLLTVIGFIPLLRLVHRPQAEAERERELAETARAHAERLAEEKARVLEQSQKDAVTDALTGLGNRRKLIDDLAYELALAGTRQRLLFALFDLDGFKRYNDTFGHPAGDALLKRLAEQLLAAFDGRAHAYRIGGDEFCVVARVPENDADEILAKTSEALSSEGESFSVGCSFGAVIMPHEAATVERALQLADRRLYRQKAFRRRASDEEPRDVLLQVLAERSPALAEHMTGVAALAEAIAYRLGLSDAEVRDLRLAAVLHDIGKTAVPDTILLKPQALNEDEWVFIRNHTLIGERILAAAPALAGAAVLVRSSHERVDGRGYPDGLGGDAIPLGARIIAVCDAFDAMISDRPYRAARSVEEAIAELRRCAGSQFDAEIVDALCELAEAGGREQPGAEAAVA